MFVVEQQKATKIDYAFAVQIEFPDCSAAGRSQANDIKVIRAPGEMFIPVIVTGMKERDCAACRWINSMGFIGF
jgi:hypothetical protein